MWKLNCWEVLWCGREPGGVKAEELGVCPAAIQESLDGVNHGKNAGRCCWAIAGTFCKGSMEGCLARKLTSCLKCEFFKLVAGEEEEDLKTTKDVLEKI
jgi:hypothetical protein